MPYYKYDCVIRNEENPEAINTLTRKGWVEAPQPPYDPAKQYCSWINCEWKVESIPTPYVQQVANWAFRSQLEIDGLFDQVQYVIDNLIGTEKIIITQQWEYGNFVLRDSLLVNIIMTQLSLTKEQMDQIFANANNLS